MKHTPTPWAITTDKYTQSDTSTDIATIYGTTTQPTEDGLGQRYVSIVANKPCYEVTEEEQLANAEFIVRAVNNHYALVEALELLADYHGPGSCPNEAFEKMNVALKNAKGSL